MSGAAIDDKLIQHITDTIVRNFHPRRIILFGSRARGDAHQDSDVDLLVEMESDLPPAERAIAIDTLFGMRNWPMDLLVYTPEEMARQRERVFSIAKIAEQEGVILYESRQ